jgi:hypothetical protein
LIAHLVTLLGQSLSACINADYAVNSSSYSARIKAIRGQPHSTYFNDRASIAEITPAVHMLIARRSIERREPGRIFNRITTFTGVFDSYFLWEPGDRSVHCITHAIGYDDYLQFWSKCFSIVDEALNDCVKLWVERRLPTEQADDFPTVRLCAALYQEAFDLR